jgi:hypothetical protein
MVTDWVGCASNFAMNNGIGSKACCRANEAILAGAAKTTACLWKHCCGLRAPAVHGETSRRSLGGGTLRISDSHAGRAPGYGIAYLPNWLEIGNLAKSSSTPPSFASTSMPLAPSKKRSPGDRPIQRWPDNEDPCRRRCSGPTHSRPHHRVAGWACQATLRVLHDQRARLPLAPLYSCRFRETPNALPVDAREASRKRPSVRGA